MAKTNTSTRKASIIRGALKGGWIAGVIIPNPCILPRGEHVDVTRVANAVLDDVIPVRSEASFP